MSRKETLKTALVTGANGFVGHHLVRLLVENGYKVYAVIRNEQADISDIAYIENIEIVYCNMENIETLAEKIVDRHIDYAYHLAWAGSSADLKADYELQLKNVLWTCRLIETVAKMQIKRVIISGTIAQLMYRDYLTEDGISPEMFTCYAVGKISTEYMCKCLCTKYGIDLCWTYISNLYGADDPTKNFINFLVESYSQKTVPTLTPAEQPADFTYVTDVVKGLMYAGERGKRNTSYYIGYGSPRPLKEYILKVRDIVNPELESGIGRKNYNGRNVDFLKIDVEKLSRDTGYHADIAFEDGVGYIVEKKSSGVISSKN